MASKGSILQAVVHACPEYQCLLAALLVQPWKFAFRYTEGELYLTKILKDKQKLKKANEKRERQEEAFRQRNAEEDDGKDDAEEVAAKKARFEESKADLQKKIKAQAGPPVFKQALFPVQANSCTQKLRGLD